MFFNLIGEDSMLSNKSTMNSITPDSGECEIRKSNSTIIPDFYNGIPANLLLNFIGFTILVILFGLLRKKAWNYGRLALLHKTDNRWMELFYGEHDENDTPEVPSPEASVNAQLSHIDRGYLSWIVTAFKITDKELLRRSGPDGLLYISFQRHLIILTGMMTVVSLGVALPINYNGGNVKDKNETFSYTTLSNLDFLSNWIWVHTIIILSYLPVGAYVMRRFMKQVREAKPGGELVAKTLLISEIPKHQCNVEDLIQYFREAFPTLTVEDVTLAHDIQRLSALDAKRDCAEQARLYCENYNRKREPLKLTPYPCGQILSCCCKTVDALEFYTQEEIRLTALVEEEKQAALSRPVGVAFVTLGTPGAARIMRRQLRSSSTIKWTIQYAPPPSDIFWENLVMPKPFWYLNAIFINLALAITLFFLTTPIVIVGQLKKLSIEVPDILNFNPLLSAFLPTLVLVSIAALMPVLVSQTELLVRHWTRSGLNRAVLKKTLLLLLLMVLILPSLGLSSAQALLDWTIKNSTTKSRWECVFLADQGAFFVNYVITAGLLGSGLELMRFPELALYTFRLCIARSRAERVHVRNAVVWEFPLGAHYAWLLLVFTMTTVYSMSCPLITPFGLLYFSVKHLVDRHNLCFAYGPSVGGGQLASTAAGAVGLAPIITQIAFLAINLVRGGVTSLAAIQLIGLAASILGLVTGVTLPASKPKALSPKRDLSTGQHFIAPVLKKKYTACTMEETLSVTSNHTDLTSTSSRSPSLEENPNLYQNYSPNTC